MTSSTRTIWTLALCLAMAMSGACESNEDTAGDSSQGTSGGGAGNGTPQDGMAAADGDETTGGSMATDDAAIAGASADAGTSGAASDAGTLDPDAAAAQASTDAGAPDGSAPTGPAPDGGYADLGSCCDAHAEPGCSEPDTERCVCELLPDCCSVGWDEACAQIVQQKFCEPDVRDCVCGPQSEGGWEQTQCCETDWTDFCASTAFIKCAGNPSCI